VAGIVVGGVVGSQLFPKVETITSTATETATKTTTATTTATITTPREIIKEVPAALPIPKKMILFDESLCVGCQRCMLACSLVHDGVCDLRLSRLVIGVPSLLESDYCTMNICRQCASPECLVACPYGAITVDPKTNARVVDAGKCVGCGKCVDACLFGAIKLNMDTKKAFKCDLCYGDPTCVKVCTQGALKYVEVR
jgi:Fe-S-cluster-containing hydrogenase component 2